MIQEHIKNYSKNIQLANIIRKQILNGTFATGERLPSDAELSKVYDIHRNTIAQGMKLLVAEGLITRAPRRGTIVTGGHKLPIFLLIPCPEFLTVQDNNSALFFRQLYKHLHLQLMDRGVHVITVPMSPTNSPEDIKESYFDVIPPKSKVILSGTWGISGLSSLKRKKCNVVYYYFPTLGSNQSTETEWKKIIFDNTEAEKKAIELLHQQKYIKPLFVLRSSPECYDTIKKLYPDLPEENIFSYQYSANYITSTIQQIFKQADKLQCDALFSVNSTLTKAILDKLTVNSNIGVITVHYLEVISYPDLTCFTLDFPELAKLTIKMFNSPDGKEEHITFKPHNIEKNLKQRRKVDLLANYMKKNVSIEI
jgi:hypothetical protein